MHVCGPKVMTMCQTTDGNFYSPPALPDRTVSSLDHSGLKLQMSTMLQHNRGGLGCKRWKAVKLRYFSLSSAA